MCDDTHEGMRPNERRVSVRRAREAANRGRRTYLVHPASENHEICIQVLQVLVAVMYPYRVVGASVDNVLKSSNKGMAVENESTHESVHHPTIEQHLSRIVEDH